MTFPRNGFLRATLILLPRMHSIKIPSFLFYNILQAGTLLLNMISTQEKIKFLRQTLFLINISVRFVEIVKGAYLGGIVEIGGL